MDTDDDPGPAIGTTGARFGGAPRRRRTARRKAADAGTPPDEETAAIPVVPVVSVTTPGFPEPDVANGPVVGMTGARFGGARRRRKPNPTPAAAPQVPQAPASEAPPPPDVEEPVAGGSAIVRPYVFTGGRTRSSFELSIETLVSAVPHAALPGLAGEHRAVLGLCREPRSVAELSAHVGVPLGVARVLVGDLAAAGAVAVHRGVGAAGPDLALMQRVLSGLRRL